MLHRLRYTAGYEAVTADRRFKITILFVAGEKVSQEPGQIKQFSKPCRSSLQAQAACTCPKLCLSAAHAPFFLGVCKRVGDGQIGLKGLLRSKQTSCEGTARKLSLLTGDLSETTASQGPPHPALARHLPLKGKARCLPRGYSCPATKRYPSRGAGPTNTNLPLHQLAFAAADIV